MFEELHLLFCPEDGMTLEESKLLLISNLCDELFDKRSRKTAHPLLLIRKVIFKNISPLLNLNSSKRWICNFSISHIFSICKDNRMLLKMLSEKFILIKKIFSKHFTELTWNFHDCLLGNCSYIFSFQILTSTDILKPEKGLSPRAVVYMSDEKIASAFISGDETLIKILDPTADKVVIGLLAAYYVWHIGYPRAYSNILQYMDHEILAANIEKNQPLQKFYRKKEYTMNIINKNNYNW